MSDNLEIIRKEVCCSIQRFIDEPVGENKNSVQTKKKRERGEKLLFIGNIPLKS